MVAAATGRTPTLYRPAGGLSNGARQAAAKVGQAEILWDVIPFGLDQRLNTAATRHYADDADRPGSVVLFHDTYSSTADVVYQFIPAQPTAISSAPSASCFGRGRQEAVTAAKNIHLSTNCVMARQRSCRCPTPHRLADAQLPIADIAGQNSA